MTTNNVAITGGTVDDGGTVNPEENTGFNIEDLFRADQFEKPAEGGSDEQQATPIVDPVANPAEPSGQSQPVQQPQPQPGQENSTQAPAAGGTDDAATRQPTPEEQLALLQQQYQQPQFGGYTPQQAGIPQAPLPQQQFTQPAQQQQAPAQPEPQQDAGVNPYAVQVPPQILNALASEDVNERALGMQHLLGAYGKLVEETVLKQVDALVPKTDAIAQVAQQQYQQQQQQQEIHNDFFGNYPQYNDPAFYPTVQAVTLQLAQQYGAQSWTPQLRDAIAYRMQQMGIVGKAQPQMPAMPQQQQPQPVVSGNNRQSNSQSTSDFDVWN